MNWQHWVGLGIVVAIAGCALWAIALLGASKDDEDWWDDDLL